MEESGDYAFGHPRKLTKQLSPRRDEERKQQTKIPTEEYILLQFEHTVEEDGEEKKK